MIYVLISFKAYGIESFIKPYELVQLKALNESNIFEGFIFYPRNLILFSLIGFKSLLSSKRRL